MMEYSTIVYAQRVQLYTVYYYILIQYTVHVYNI